MLERHVRQQEPSGLGDLGGLGGGPGVHGESGYRRDVAQAAPTYQGDPS